MVCDPRHTFGLALCDNRIAGGAQVFCDLKYPFRLCHLLTFTFLHRLLDGLDATTAAA
jgi:hypothetical protein